MEHFVLSPSVAGAIILFPASKVLVRNKYGKFIPGVIAAKPPHFMTPAERQNSGSTSIQSLVIDIGATSKEDAVENFGIRIVSLLFLTYISP